MIFDEEDGFPRSKPFVFDPVECEQVTAIAGHGLPHEQIADLVRDGITVNTLRKHFVHELLVGKARANGGTMFQKVMDGELTAMILWSKTQLRGKKLIG